MRTKSMGLNFIIIPMFSAMCAMAGVSFAFVIVGSVLIGVGTAMITMEVEK